MQKIFQYSIVFIKRWLYNYIYYMNKNSQMRRVGMKEKIKEKVKSLMKDLEGISKFLYDNPELGGQEFKASAYLEEYLEKQGFTVEAGICNLPTAFKATYKSKMEGPQIAFLCEYDALPQIGHGCGHNLIAAMGVGGALGLKAIIDEIGGSIVVFGTPAEEICAGKAIMAEKGAFEGVAAALMAHPAGVTKESGTTLAINALKFEFFGKTAHAASCPEKGINALDAVISTFNSINALRQHIGKDARIHGIISDGGKAPNIIPDYAAAKFYVREGTKKQLKELSDKVINCAKAAALSTGTEVKISNFERGSEDLRTNSALSKAFNENLLDLGEVKIEKADGPSGSTDMGNLSYVVPAIHPMIGIGDENLAGHTVELAACTQSEKGREALLKGACALAFTGFDVITCAELREKVSEEFMNIQ
jgi:amidohydrolase